MPGFVALRASHRAAPGPCSPGLTPGPRLTRNAVKLRAQLDAAHVRGRSPAPVPRDVEEFPTETSYALVRGKKGTPKGGKARAVPMSGRLCRALAEHHAMEGGRVLRREDGSDMTTDSQRTILRRVALYAGLPAYGMHALRHCFSSRMMNGGGGAKVVMRLLEHAKLATTERYIHAADEHCRSAVDRLLPA
ncbi:tyrosine-type recombinase/integrase [Nannocystis sp.]|uniref:tyrosine-type recombinase/integrase n=1 Tax=Nannocystis sp. TaxID=1962667 RepID=UPI0025DECC73|nr:tyrosine-type recombinase/integrase [Nannocystis sp.]